MGLRLNRSTQFSTETTDSNSPIPLQSPASLLKTGLTPQLSSGWVLLSAQRRCERQGLRESMCEPCQKSVTWRKGPSRRQQLMCTCISRKWGTHISRLYVPQQNCCLTDDTDLCEELTALSNMGRESTGCDMLKYFAFVLISDDTACQRPHYCHPQFYYFEYIFIF